MSESREPQREDPEEVVVKLSRAEAETVKHSIMATGLSSLKPGTSLSMAYGALNKLRAALLAAPAPMCPVCRGVGAPGYNCSECDGDVVPDEEQGKGEVGLSPGGVGDREGREKRLRAHYRAMGFGDFTGEEAEENARPHLDAFVEVIKQRMNAALTTKYQDPTQVPAETVAAGQRDASGVDCPDCGGYGETNEGEDGVDDEGNTLYAHVPCPTCDGTGEASDQ